ncbi:MAG TPA: Fe-S cluster assembly protein SufD [Solirubrobacteraceae bacterium]|nr:Fe-S cluster assembly protein SufD [Solirubrobacteraceae bacterium]
MASPADAPAVTEPPFLIDRRRRGAELAATLDLPRFRGKPGWEFTSLEKLELDAYAPVAGGDLAVAEQTPLVVRPPVESVALTQVDGAFAPAPHVASEGPLVMPLSVAAQNHPELVEPHLGSVVDAEDPFVARNEAGWLGGAFVYVPRWMKVEAPISLRAIQAAQGGAMHWRVLVVLEEGAEAEVWDQYVTSGSDGDGHLFTTVTELVVGQTAKLRYVSAQGLGEKAWIFGNQRATVDRDGSLDWVVLGFGAGNGRVAQETDLRGRGAHGKVTGAYATHGRQHLDFATTQEHASPDTTSDLAFRGILDGRSTTVWSGMIEVDEGAQRIDAFQESRNLLLTKRAHADAIPGLEISANDVRCTHAAAIAQIDPEQVFYLRARGLSEPLARRVVIEGFLQATVERFEQGQFREALAAALEHRLEQILG